MERREKKSPGRNCFPPGLTFATVHSATNDESIIHFQQEESIRRRRSHYVCTIGDGKQRLGNGPRQIRVGWQRHGTDTANDAGALSSVADLLTDIPCERTPSRPIWSGRKVLRVQGHILGYTEPCGDRTKGKTPFIWRNR